jgi:tetratricopeptide (TPR) repeat protein
MTWLKTKWRMYRLPAIRFAVALMFLACSLSYMTLASASQQKTETFSQLVDQAKRAGDENRLDEAVTLYSKALTVRPQWADGWWSLGTIEYELDHYAKAAVDFEKLIALQPKNGTAHAMLGLCQFELGKDELSLKNLLASERLRIVNDEQLRKVALYHLALLQLRAGQYGDARGTLAQLVNEGVKTKEVILSLGLAVLMMPPANMPADGSDGAKIIENVGEAEVLLIVRDFERAKQKYAEVTAAFPDFPNLHFANGRFLLAVQQPDEAVVEFQKELKNNPAHVKSLLEIAAVRYRTDSADGLKYAQEALKLAPQLPFVHYLLGLLYTDTENFPQAISELEIAQKFYKDTPEIYFVLGTAYTGAGRKEDAIRARAIFKRLEAQEGGSEPVSPIDGVLSNNPPGSTP